MFRTDAPDNVGVKPPYAPIGVAGYYQDTAPGGGTEITADWMNHVQEELCQLIVWGGYALNKADDTQLRTLMQAKTDGIVSHASDTGTSSTTHKAAIIACNSSRAAGTDAACIACAGSIAHADATAAIAGIGTIVSKSGSAVFGKNCELAEFNAFGGGFAAGAVAETGANQNLTWLVTLADGIEYAKMVKVGDPNAKTATATLDGAAGRASVERLTMPVGANKVLETQALPVIPAAGTANVVFNNTMIDVNSVLYFTLDNVLPAGSWPIIRSYVVGMAGQATVDVSNLSINAVASGNITMMVINPA